MNRKNKNLLVSTFAVLTFFLLCCVGNCQTSNVSGNITDSTSTVWTQSNVQLTFVPSPNQPNLGIYNINGVPLNQANFNLSTTADNSGNFNFPAVYDVKQVTPTGASWVLTITPNASVTPTQVTGIQITGATFNLTSIISANIKPPSFPAVYSPMASRGYNDAEVFPVPLPGGAYFNVTTQQLRIWTGFAWVSAAGGSGSTVAPPAFALQFANSGVTNLTADATLTFNTTTKQLTSPIVNEISNCSIYAGATSDAKIKACLTAQQSISLNQGSKMYDPETTQVSWLTDPLRQLFGTKTGGSLELGAVEYDLSDEFVIPNLYTVFGQGKGGNTTGCPGSCSGGVNTILKAVGIQAECFPSSMTYQTTGNQINVVYSSACTQTANSKVVLGGVPKGNIWYGSYTITTVTDSTHAVFANNGAAHNNNDNITTFDGLPLVTRKSFVELGDTLNATASQINRLSIDCNATIGLIGLHSNVVQEFSKFNEVSVRNCYGMDFYFDKNPSGNVANIDPTGSEGLFLAAQAVTGTITVSRSGSLSQIVIPNSSFQADANGVNAGVPTATPMDTMQIENFNEPNLNQASTFNGIYEILNEQLNTPSAGFTTYYFLQEVGSGAVFPTPVFTGSALTSFSGTTCTGSNPIVCVLNTTTGTGYGFPPYVTQTGGTCVTPPVVTAQANKSPGAIAILRITNQGNCSVPPTFGFATDNVTGVTGGQFYSGTPLKINEPGSYIRGIEKFTLNAGNSSTPQAAACVQFDVSGDLSNIWCQAARNEFATGIEGQPISISTHNLGGTPINNGYRVAYRIANGQAANLWLERENLGSSTSGLIDEFTGVTRPESIMPFYSYGVGLNNYAGVFLGTPVIQGNNSRELDWANAANTTVMDERVDDSGNSVWENLCDYTVQTNCMIFMRPSASTAGAPNTSAFAIDGFNHRALFYRTAGDIAFSVDANNITAGRAGHFPDLSGTFALLEHLNCLSGTGPTGTPDSVHFLLGNCTWAIPPGSAGGGVGTFPDGNAGAPGISWTNETTSGWFRSTTNDFSMSINSAALVRYLRTASQAMIMTAAADICWGSSGTGTIDFCFHRPLANTIRTVTSIGGSTLANFQDGTHTATLYATTTVCSQTASPAACGAATAGKVQVAAAATSLVIDSTTFTNSTGCWFTYDVGGITAPTNIASMFPPYISARTAGTSITITLPVAPATNAVNIQFGCNN